MRSKSSLLRAVLVGSTLSGTMTSGAFAQSNGPIEVQAQSLSAAVLNFARQTNVQITAPGDLLKDRFTEGVQGTTDPEAALRQLLSGTGLTFDKIQNGTVVLSLIGQNGQSDELTTDLIIVEGERIGRSIAETPANVRVFNGPEVDTPVNRDLRDAIEAVPNVVYEQGPYLPSIRGIDGTAGVEGGTSLTSGAQPRVPIVIDGMALPVPQGATAATIGVWDVQRVEVARGPQASTSGRNAIGGAVRVFTNDPSFEWEAATQVGYFNQDGTANGAFLFNVPILEDQVAFRIAGEGYAGENFVEYQIPGQLDLADEFAEQSLLRLRPKLLVEPEAVPGLSMLFTLDYQDLTTNFDPNAVDRGGNGFVTTVGTAPLLTRQMIYSTEVNYEISERFEIEQQVAFLDFDVDIPNTSVNFDLNQETTRLLSDTVLRFRDIGIIERGFIGYAYEQQNEDIVDMGQLASTVDGEIENQGIFGEVEIGVLADVTLLLGGRVEIDERERSITVPGLAFSQTTSAEDTAFLPKAGLRYQVNDETLVGYTYSEGYRAGGADFNLFAGAPFFIPGPLATTFEPERLRQHELFVRGEGFEGDLSYSASAFYYTFKDAQVLGADPAAPFLIGNLPKARGFGAEIEGAYRVLPGLTVSAGLGLLDTKITNGGASGFQGEELARAPNVTANGRLEYISDLGFDVAADIRYVGGQLYRLGGVDIDGYTVVDLSAGYDYSFEDVDLRVDAFIKNVADTRYITRDFDGGVFVNAESVGQPRTFGLAATLRF
ncbi:MAG: TonB-dependent receptor [Pseudomonadota bacterium]